MHEWIHAWMDEWTNKWIDEWINAWMNERMDEWMNKWMDEWIDVWMDRCTNGWMNKQLNELLDEWINEWMNAWMNEWINGRMNKCITLASSRIGDTGFKVASLTDVSSWEMKEPATESPKFTKFTRGESNQNDEITLATHATVCKLCILTWRILNWMQQCVEPNNQRIATMLRYKGKRSLDKRNYTRKMIMIKLSFFSATQMMLPKSYFHSCSAGQCDGLELLDHIGEISKYSLECHCAHVQKLVFTDALPTSTWPVRGKRCKMQHKKVEEGDWFHEIIIEIINY